MGLDSPGSISPVFYSTVW